VYGTLEPQAMVVAQGDLLFGWLPKWGIIVQPVGFVLFLTAAIAENKRVPFDLAEGESEIVGYFVEYSGMKFGMFFVGEYLGLLLISAMIVTLFFGGWAGPLLPPLVWFLLKMFFVVFLFLLVRATFPRYRYDQLMRLGWKVFLPISLLWVVVAAGAWLALPHWVF
jgi:NADH-quinone oxidoreductase subunit H